MKQVIFGTAEVGQTILRLFRACLHIRFHMWTRICYVTEIVCIRENLWGTHMLCLKNQTVLEFLVNEVAPHYHSHCQKLADHNRTPTLLHINRRDEDSFRDRIYILEA